MYKGTQTECKNTPKEGIQKFRQKKVLIMIQQVCSNTRRNSQKIYKKLHEKEISKGTLLKDILSMYKTA